MTSETIIYGLMDPRDRMVRYIGKSTRGLKRIAEHSDRRFNSLKVAWFDELKTIGLKPDWVILERVGTEPFKLWSDDAMRLSPLSACERWWIAYAKASGWPLVNLTAGGDGTHGHRQSSEVREKHRQANLGKKRSPEQIERNSLARIGIKRTPESIEKQRASCTGKVQTAETRAKISKSNKGQKRSPEVRQRMSLAAREREQRKRDIR